MPLISPVPALSQGPGASGSRARTLSAPGALTPPPPARVSAAEHAAAAAAAAPARAAASTVDLVQGALSRPAAPLREARSGAALARAASGQDASGPKAVPGAPVRTELAAGRAPEVAPRESGIDARGQQPRRASLLATA